MVASTRTGVAKSATKYVERRIKFYRLDSGQDDNRRPIAININTVLQYLDSLSHPRTLHWRGPDGSVYGCWVERVTYPQRLTFGLFRNSALPQAELGRRLIPISEQEIVEPIHVVFFSNWILGSDFEIHGPRISRLAAYITSMAKPVCPPVSIVPLVHRSALTQLLKMQHLRRFSLRIRPSYATTIREASVDLSKAFDAAITVGDAEEIELEFKARGRSRKWISDKFLEIAQSLRNLPDIEDGAIKFDVRGLNGATDRIEAIDMLADALVTQKRIIVSSGQSGPLDPLLVFSAIEDSYRELRNELELASAVYP